MNAIIAIPIEIRLAALFLLGACLGSAANLCTYRLAWHRRECAIHSLGFRVRQMIIGLFTGIALAALYWWEIGCLGLLPAGVPTPTPPGVLTVLHAQYAAHVVLLWLMLVASMIDIDEKIIPDAITIPGMLIGLLLAAACPWSQLPDLMDAPMVGAIPPEFWHAVSADTWPFLQLASPNRWPACLDGFPHAGSLVVCLACWWLWCLALIPGRWYVRHGRLRAWQLMFARAVRRPATYRILLLGLIGTAAMAMVWFHGGRSWSGLLSAAVGMAAGGGLIWSVRIIGTAALKREAMGFGDVTLVAMIGTFLGWQSCLIIFFLAPMAGLVVGLLQVILFRDTEIPYGPFLCLAAVVVIVCWTAVWDWVLGAFAVGWLVPVVVVFCMALMGVMLGAWKLAVDFFRGQ